MSTKTYNLADEQAAVVSDALAYLRDNNSETEVENTFGFSPELVESTIDVFA